MTPGDRALEHANRHAEWRRQVDERQLDENEQKNVDLLMPIIERAIVDDRNEEQTRLERSWRINCVSSYLNGLIVRRDLTDADISAAVAFADKVLAAIGTDPD